MLREVSCDDIELGGKWFHPTKGSTSRAEAEKYAEYIRKKYGSARVIDRERGVECKVTGGIGTRWVPYRGYVVFRGE